MGPNGTEWDRIWLCCIQVTAGDSILLGHKPWAKISLRDVEWNIVAVRNISYSTVFALASEKVLCIASRALNFCCALHAKNSLDQLWAWHVAWLELVKLLYCVQLISFGSMYADSQTESDRSFTCFFKYLFMFKDNVFHYVLLQSNQCALCLGHKHPDHILRTEDSSHCSTLECHGKVKRREFGQRQTFARQRTTKDDKACCVSSAFRLQWLGRPRCREVEQVTGASNLRSTLGQNLYQNAPLREQSRKRIICIHM